MDIIERMGQLHSGSARLLVYNLGGDPMQIINDWQSRIGDSVPLADWFGGANTLTLDDAANGAYWDIVKLAFPEAVPAPNTVYSITYARGPDSNPEGSVVESQQVLVKNGMTFYVTVTDKS